ncbi:MAG: TolC family protein [Spirochaetaceae bacterium]|jgi:outer membrane protein TolC|nr:TolC family protein [Spirochaetaceae bacterium]
MTDPIKKRTEKRPLNLFLRKAGALLFAAALVFPVFGQEAPGEEETPAAPAKKTLTVEEAVKLAVENNLSLESARISMLSKKRVSDLSWNQFLPVIGAGASLGGGFTPNSSTGTLNAPVEYPAKGSGFYGTTPIDNITTEVSQTQLAFQGQIAWSGLNIALFEGLKKLKKDYEAGAISYNKAKIQLERDVRKAYYNILLMQEQIELLRQSYNNAQRQEESARANYQAGLAPELYSMQAQVARENLKPQMDQAETGLHLSKASFAMNLGIPFEEDFDLVPISLGANFIPFDVQDMIKNAAKNKPDIAELKGQIEALKSAKKALSYQLLTPSINLSWGVSGGTAFTKTALSGSGNPLIDRTTEGWSDFTVRDSFTLSLSWSLNGFLPFTSQAANIKDMDDNIRSMNVGLAQAVRGTEIEVYSTIASLEQARVSAEAGRLTVNLADRTYRLTNEAYQAGLQNLLEVQNAELQLRQARIGLLQQQVNFLTGIIDLEYAVGAPFGELLKKTTQP